MKRGQVTIFIIIGIIVVAGIIFAILYFTGKTPSVAKISSEDPNVFLSTCLQSTLKQEISEEAFSGGNGSLKVGFAFPERLAPTRVSYLCYSGADYSSCANLYAIFPYFESGLKSSLNDEVHSCYESLIADLENQNNVKEHYTGFNVSVKPNRVTLNIEANITTTKKGAESGTKTYRGFKIEASSNVYGLLQTANSMTNVISRSCSLNPSDISSYPDYNINSYNTISQSTIYAVKDRSTGEQFNFATRGCVIPAI